MRGVQQRLQDREGGVIPFKLSWWEYLLIVLVLAVLMFMALIFFYPE